MIFCIDFDNTIVNEKGKAIKGAFRVLKKILENEHEIILWTVREGKPLTEAVEFLESNNVKLLGINSNPNFNSRKPLCDFFIDDRNLGCPIYFNEKGNKCVDWDEIEKILMNMRAI